MAQYNIHFLQTAEIELKEAYNWYEERQKGLGDRLIAELSAYLDSISENPYKFARKYGREIRFAPLRVFPFVIAYWPEENDRDIYVVSIFHTSRNPKKFFT